MNRYTSKQSGISQQRISQARTVLKHAPELAESVLTGSLSLDKAYEQAKIRKEAANNHEAQFQKLSEAAPDLADLVTEEQLSLGEARSALNTREIEIRQKKYDMAESIYRLEDSAKLMGNDIAMELTAEFLANDGAIYQDHAKRSIDGVIEAVKTFRDNSDRLLKKLEGKRNAG